MKCECELCKRSIKFDEFLREVPDKWKNFAVKIYNDLNNAEFEFDVAESIIDGSWPTEDENIKLARKKE